MITKIAMIPGILIIGSAAILLNLNVWLTMAIGLVAGVALISIDAVRERRKKSR